MASVSLPLFLPIQMRIKIVGLCKSWWLLGWNRFLRVRTRREVERAYIIESIKPDRD